MSQSIDQLLKGLGAASKRQPTVEGRLNNDRLIPDESLELKDQFHMNFRTPSVPRNGAGYSMPRQNLITPVSERFVADGDIDPNVIRSKVDPDSAQPSRYGQSLFSLMPASVVKPHNQVDLIKKAHESAQNYRNRYAAPAQPNTMPIDPNTGLSTVPSVPEYDPPSYVESTRGDTLETSRSGV